MGDSSLRYSQVLTFSTEARRFNIALLASLLACMALWGIALQCLEWADRLPAPPITATNCIDEKFKFLHERDLEQTNVVAVGSSVTWRNLDFSAFLRRYGSAVRPIDGATCFLSINQIAFLSDFYLDHMPKVRAVLSVLAMRDFSECAQNPTEFFDTEDTAGYVFGKSSGRFLYFKNFRPRSFYRNIRDLPAMRTGGNPQEMVSLSMDRFGSSRMRLNPPQVRQDVRVDPTCFPALKEMSESLARRGVDLIIALMPPMPAWLERYDPEGARDRAFRNAVATHIDPTHTRLIDAAKDLSLGNEHFTDPAHFQAESVPLFMEYLIRKLDETGADKILGE